MTALTLDNPGPAGEVRAMTDEVSAVRERIIAAIKDYLSLLEPRGADQRPSSYDLAKALDALVQVYHQTPDVETDTDDLGPRVEERPLLDKAAAAFPDLGYYALVEPEGGPDQHCGMSDAIGDLAEIAVDLIEVLELFDLDRPNDAIWSFRWGYQFHWGRHLHELRTYLHALSAW